MESAETTSPSYLFASRTPSLVLPQAVGPTTQMIFSAIAVPPLTAQDGSFSAAQTYSLYMIRSRM